ncbi:hypothetical protein Tco_1278209 [Tanacetum coccineum]
MDRVTINDEQEIFLLLWKDIIMEFSQSTNCNNVLNILRRLVCGVAVYYIWQEKNARIFGNGKKDEKMLCKEIKETIRMMLLSLQVKESKAMKMDELRFRLSSSPGPSTPPSSSAGPSRSAPSLERA